MTEIEEITKDDYIQLAHFLSENLKYDSGFWIERFDFLWDKNPAFDENQTRGLVLKKNQAIKGFIGKFPAKFMLNGIETTSSNGIGLVIDKSLRGSGLGKKLKDEHRKISDGQFIFATSSNEIALKINRSLGFKLLPRGIGDHNVYSMVSFDAIKSLKLYSYLFKNIKSKYLIYAIQEMPSLRKLVYHREVNIDNICTIQKTSSKFDIFWENTKSIYKYTNIRDSSVIQWYLIPTKYSEREIYAEVKDDKILGFIVVRMSHIKKILFMLSIDLWVDKRNAEGTIEKLIYYAAEMAKSKGCSLLLSPHFSQNLGKIYDKFGLIKLFGRKRNDLYFALDYDDNYIEYNNSYFTYMSGDKFLGKKLI